MIDDDSTLLRAVRQRLLREIRHGGGGSSTPITNNVYGGTHGGGGVMGEMAGHSQEKDPGDYNYMVDILKEDTPNGWKKSVHRHREPKDGGGGEVIEDQKKNKRRDPWA